jgi:CHAT domain-containing protein/Flp pilus assembly protein TadD
LSIIQKSLAFGYNRLYQLWRLSMFTFLTLPIRSLTVFYLIIRNTFLLLAPLSLSAGILAAQNDKSIPTLEPGRPVERELAGGGSHSYQIVFTSNQFFRVVVDQRGIDVVVILFGVDGKQLNEVDSPNGTQGPEILSAIAETTGKYRLEVRSLEKDAPAGHYQVNIEEWRPATEQDRVRATAKALFQQAEQLFEQGTTGALHSAITKYEESLRLYHSIRDVSAEVFILNRIGYIYNSFGEKQKALDYYLQILALNRGVGDRNGEAQTLDNIGGIYDDMGEKQKALDYYNQTLALSRTLGNLLFEAGALSNIAGIYNDLGERQLALNYYKQALPLRRAAGDKKGEATTLSNLGGTYYDLGDQQTALDYFTQALPIRRAVGDRNGEAVTLSNIGRVYNNLGDKQKALEYTLQALSIFRVIGNHSFEAGVLTNLGLIYYDLGDKQKAIDYYAQALPLSRALGDRPFAAKILHNLMNTYESLNDLRVATFYGKMSVDTYQEMRLHVQGLDRNIQKTFLRAEESTYRALANLLIKQSRSSEAQQVINAFKDEQFFDFDQMRPKHFSPITRTPREEEFASRLDHISSEVGANGAKGDELETQLKTSLNQFSTALKQVGIEFAGPADQADKVSEVSDTVKMQTMLRQLNQETGQKAIAIYTLVGKEGFHALLVTAEGITSVSTTVNGEDLSDKARQLWALLQSADYDPRALSNELYNIVFKPIEGKVPKDTKTLLWSLDGNLRYLPMGALYDGRQYLVERFNQVVFTRAENERLTRAVNATWQGSGFATSAPHKVVMDGKSIEFSSLDFVKDEMQIFRTQSNPKGIIAGEVFPDAQFNKAALLAALKQKRPLVHISSHFRFRPGDEANSFLLLGDGSVLTVAEMKGQSDLFQGVELLTLSACDTAAQRPDANGREIDTLAELAQRLGAGSVLASLWPVRDRSTAQLMKAFYKNREGGKATKAEALRRAQLDLLYGNSRIVNQGSEAPLRGSSTDEEIIVEAKYRVPFRPDKSRPFAHPYYWSPFVLFGNWR